MIWAVVIGLAAVLIAVLGDLLGSSGYLQAWLYSILIAIAALYVLSIPRYISVDDLHLEIHCMVEMTRIDIRDIATVRRVDAAQLRGKLWIVLGSYGFFGYFGYFFNWREWELVKTYATQWANFVEIEDIYEQKYIVSCPHADHLIETIMQAKLKH